MTEDQPPLQPTIRNAVIHLLNEQPLLADLFERPAPGDVGLVCTNLRKLDGKRPIFADHVESVFFFPYQHIRFVEIPPGADGQARVPTAAEAAPIAAADEPEEDLELDEDFLRRIREV